MIINNYDFFPELYIYTYYIYILVMSTITPKKFNRFDGVTNVLWNEVDIVKVVGKSPVLFLIKRLHQADVTYVYIPGLPVEDMDQILE